MIRLGVNTAIETGGMRPREEVVDGSRGAMVLGFLLAVLVFKVRGKARKRRGSLRKSRDATCWSCLVKKIDYKSLSTTLFQVSCLNLNP